MLRRFELYSIARSASAGAVGDLERACRSCGRYIPEVLHSASGRNESPVPVTLVWEHAFASVDAYRRYMVHPFHAAVLDRYLLHDSPERVVTHNALGAGLVGYECDGPVYRMDDGVRRLVLVAADKGAPPDVVAALMAELTGADAGTPGLRVSVTAPNTLGRAWFDGVTPVGPPPRWTHVWEQGFESAPAFASYQERDLVRAHAERASWEKETGGVVTDVVELWYPIARDRIEGDTAPT